MSKEFYQDMEIDKIEWLSKNPDINPIQNLWVILAQDVYNKGQWQFDNLHQLRTQIEQSWEKITMATCRKLSKSMHKCMILLISKQGATICY